jgi:uncharacterized membrane protein
VLARQALLCFLFVGLFASKVYTHAYVEYILNIQEK